MVLLTHFLCAAIEAKASSMVGKNSILSYTPSHYFLNLKGDILVHIKHWKQCKIVFVLGHLSVFLFMI